MAAIGMLNGLLPCGLVYAGLSNYWLTGSVSGGFVFIILFGFGTMLLTPLIPYFAGFKLRRRINRFTSNTAVNLAILFILKCITWIRFNHPKSAKYRHGDSTSPQLFESSVAFSL